MTPYYEHGGITIYHGDCRDVLPSLSFDVMVTDSPYGVGFRYHTYEDTPEAFTASVLPVLINATNGEAAICMSFRQMHTLPPCKWALCWYKPGSTRRNAVGGFSIWEPIFLYGSGWRVPNDAKYLPDCVNHDLGNTHPCPKPEALFRWIIGHHNGGAVVDPFMGSGTTLVAAKWHGRKAIGIEIEERYCEIAAKRLAQEILTFEAVS